MLGSLVVKFLKARWGSILPEVFKAAAEGRFGPKVQAVYWWSEKRKTISGAALLALGAAAETLCATYPDMTWACGASGYIYAVGAFLTLVGLVDGGVRAPWPKRPDGLNPMEAEAMEARKE